MSSTSARPLTMGHGQFEPFNQEKLSTLPDKITVFIKRNIERPHIFFCVNCSAPLFQYQGMIISLIPGDLNADSDQPIVQFPITLYCKHSSDKWGPCKSIYLIEGWAV